MNTNWQPNKTQPLLILSHQRSGGTWFQKALTPDYYYLGEYFFPWHEIKYKNPFGTHGLNYTRLKNPNWTTKEQKINFIAERMNFLKNEIFLIKPIHSIKIHVTTHVPMLQNNEINYLNENYQIILYKRRDEAATFWSYLISEETLSYNSFSDQEKLTDSLNISENSYKTVLKMFKLKNRMYAHSAKIFKTTDVIYYEDLLSQKPDWLNLNSEAIDIDIQNNRKKIKINNLEQILEWVRKDIGDSFSLALLLSIK